MTSRRQARRRCYNARNRAVGVRRASWHRGGRVAAAWRHTTENGVTRYSVEHVDVRNDEKGATKVTRNDGRRPYREKMLYKSTVTLQPNGAIGMLRARRRRRNRCRLIRERVTSLFEIIRRRRRKSKSQDGVTREYAREWNRRRVTGESIHGTANMSMVLNDEKAARKRCRSATARHVSANER